MQQKQVGRLEKALGENDLQLNFEGQIEDIRPKRVKG